MYRILGCILVVLFLFGAVSADVPHKVNYQGRLTDDSGDPIADGDYELQFVIYNASSSGTQLWSSGYRTVSVANGLFEYELGSNVDFTENLFESAEIWLGVVLGNPPVAKLPRVQMTSNFFAMRAITADTALAVGRLTHDLVLDQEGDGSTEARIDLGNSPSEQYANFTLYHNGDRIVHIYGETYGDMLMKHKDEATDGVRLLCNTYGGALSLGSYSSSDEVFLNPGATELDEKVVLPESSIEAEEILDEPGIAQNDDYSGETISPTGVTNIVGATINVPGPGYVVAMAHGIGRIAGTSLGSAIVGLELAYNTTPNSAYATSFGFTNAEFSEWVVNFSTIAVQRIFECAEATTLNVYLNGYRAYDAGEARVLYSHILLTYYPTAYGGITKTVSASEAGGYDNAVPVQVSDLDGKKTETMYEVDIRELVSKARLARIKALEAELELKNALLEEHQ
jgi:hypothetical protein